MKNIIKLSFTAILVFLCYYGQAQIRFEQGLTWLQVREKAKTEHKYIFIDCYATWCAPCKWMEKHVYNEKTVGNTYNAGYICLKVQMDKTPQDNQKIKSMYSTAMMLQRDFQVDAYPTLFFFDPDGNPVHKVSGMLDAKHFIKLASEAKNPSTQYYTLLRNFQPGKLDTAEERALANTFFYSDKILAGKLAEDYLTRVPDHILSSVTSQQLMVDFKESSQIKAVVLNYLNTHLKADNLELIKAFDILPEVHVMAMAYIRGLNDSGLSKKTNQQFLSHYYKDPEVHGIAKSYIDGLPEDSLYLPKTIHFLSAFTSNASERGFDVFYHHLDRVDTVMKSRGFAQIMSVYIIGISIVKPMLAASKQSGNAPDFDGLKATLIKQYDTALADKVVTNGKVDWYKYEVVTQKRQQYWPQLIDAKIRQTEQTGADTVDGNRQGINNIAYSYAFLHSNNLSQLQTTIGWLKTIVDKHGYDASYVDTYACLLYKAGKVDSALAYEEIALNEARKNKKNDSITQFTKTIERMKKGEKIWLEAEYQDN